MLKLLYFASWILSCFMLLSGLVSAASPVLLFQEDFENASFASRGWYDSTTLQLSTTEKHSGNSSVEYRFLLGAATPTVSGGAIRRLFIATNEVYVSYWVKYSANYTGSNHTYHPHEFMIMTNADTDYHGPSVSHLTAYIEQNEGVPILALQDASNISTSYPGWSTQAEVPPVATETRATSGCNGTRAAETATLYDCYSVGTRNNREWRVGSVYFQDATGTYYKNNWHHIEAYFKLNTIANGIGQADGIIRYWYDGTLIIERTNIIMRTNQYPNMMFNQFLIAPYIGDGSPVDQTMWVDDLTLRTSRPSRPSPPANLQAQ